jgi:two-component system chemotaxis response regulator CheB
VSLAQEKPTSSVADPYRVMVVDDSAVIRGLIGRILESDPNIRVVATASNGEQAIRMLGTSAVEVVVLDIEMPVMDGLTALPKLLAINPHIKIIMASTLTQRNAQISFKALAAGATDYIPKPTASRDINQGEGFHRELREKVKALGESYRHSGAPAFKPSVVSARAAMPKVPSPPAARATRLTTVLGKPAEALLIGSSTGGPQALLSLLKDFDRSNQMPILITQHMPPTFTTILAEHISRASGRPCAEALDGQAVERGRIYLAPGDWHMLIESDGGKKVIRLNQNPPVNFCRPAVDPMFESAAVAFGGHVLALVLTGMGQDGMNGGRKVVEQGGTVIAQDEATSVVWGMPGAAAGAGICKAILPLERIAAYIHDFPRRLVK